MVVWVEELRQDNFKICLREAKIFDGPHNNIKIVSEFNFIFLQVYYFNKQGLDRICQPKDPLCIPVRAKTDIIMMSHISASLYQTFTIVKKPYGRN